MIDAIKMDKEKTRMMYIGVKIRKDDFDQLNDYAESQRINRSCVIRNALIKAGVIGHEHANV